MGKNRFGREDSGTQVQKSGRQLDGGGGGGGGVSGAPKSQNGM